jgi:hypothetical protein
MGGSNQSLCVHMSKPPKVVPITVEKRMSERKRRVIAADSESHRVIFGIAKRRFAFDILISVSELQPGTDEQPTRVLLMKRNKPSPAG